MRSSGANWRPLGIYAERKSTQGLEYVCAYVGNIADCPMTKNIRGSTGGSDAIIREGLSGPSNVSNSRRRLQRAMKETELLGCQDVDRVAEDSLDEESEEREDAADKGSIQILFVWSTEPNLKSTKTSNR